MSFGSTLQDLREEAGLSQSDLAKAAGISTRSLQNWEIDRCQPRLDAILKLAEALKVEPGDLLKPGDGRESPKKGRGRPRKEK